MVPRNRSSRSEPDAVIHSTAHADLTKKRVLDHAEYTVHTRQHELDHTDHTDQDSIYMPWTI